MSIVFIFSIVVIDPTYCTFPIFMIKVTRCNMFCLTSLIIYETVSKNSECRFSFFKLFNPFGWRDFYSINLYKILKIKYAPPVCFFVEKGASINIVKLQPEFQQYRPNLIEVKWWDYGESSAPSCGTVLLHCSKSTSNTHDSGIGLLLTTSARRTSLT